MAIRAPDGANNKDSCAISPSHLAERGVALVEAEKLKYRIAT